MFGSIRDVVLSISVIGLMASDAIAENIAPPSGDVLLTVSGDVDVTNVADTFQFDKDTLLALEQTSFSTSTMWTDGVVLFEGVSLADFAEFMQIESGSLLARAINDYAVEIPLEDAVEGGPILAYRMNGDFMSVRDKGPLWVVYPYDADPGYQNDMIYARSIWQVDRIQVIN